MCKKLVPITIQKHSLNIREVLHATKILKILYFHNVFQYQAHTEICTFHMVTILTLNEIFKLCIGIYFLKKHTTNMDISIK